MAMQSYKPAAMKEDGTPDLDAVQRDWMAIVERHERKRTSWIKRGDTFVKIYADSETNSVERKYCVVWANVQTRAPAVYSRPPKCVVSRRYQTANETLRTAVTGLERVTNIQIEDSKLHPAIMSARFDRLVPGRGTIWLRYEAEDDGKQVTLQKVCAEHVAVKDFGHGEARTWEEVDCAWKRTYMSEEKLKARFGEDVITRCSVTLDYAEKDAPDDERQATVYEIWCKSRKATYWLAKTAKTALEVGPVPLDLKGFWPFPKPVFATLTNDNCIPTPDPVYYQDQAREITRLTRRIDKLTDALKLVGFYPAGPTTEGRAEIERALTPGMENKMIPVPSWAAFAEKGGVGAIQYLPVKDVAYIIEACVKLRQQLLNDVDQITGVSDIMRGETNATETLGAQQLKSQYGSQRIRDTKDDFVRFACEAVQITAEIVGEHFTPENLARMAALPAYEMQPPPPPVMDPATGQPAQQQPPPPPPQPMRDENGQPVVAKWIQLLRNQLARDVLVDVETDSTVQPDEDAEKQRRVEMFQTLSTGLAPLIELQQLDPKLAGAIVPVWGKALTFMLAGFRAGRELEETVEEMVTKIQQMAEAHANAPPQPPQPTIDEQIKAKKVEQDGQLGNRELDIKAAEAVSDHHIRIAEANKPQIVKAPNGGQG